MVKSTTRKRCPAWVLVLPFCCPGSNSCIAAKAEAAPLQAEQAKKRAVVVHHRKPAPASCLQRGDAGFDRHSGSNSPVTRYPVSDGLGSRWCALRNIGPFQSAEEAASRVHDQGHMDVVVAEEAAHLLHGALLQQCLRAGDHDVFHTHLRGILLNHAAF